MTNCVWTLPTEKGRDSSFPYSLTFSVSFYFVYSFPFFLLQSLYSSSLSLSITETTLLFAISFLISVFFSSTCLLPLIFFLCSLFHYLSLSLSFNFYFAIFYLRSLSLFLFTQIALSLFILHNWSPSFLISFLLHRLFFFFLL